MKAKLPAGRAWQNQPASEAQIQKLLVMAKNQGVMGVIGWADDLRDHAGAVIDWINAEFDFTIHDLEDLTKGQIQRIFDEL